ncbi:MAG: RluA family pseudouridine synthase [Vicinamibacterales bacterium]
MALNRGWSYREQVGPESAGRSVLEHLTATRTHSSAAEWTVRLQQGEVELDGGLTNGTAILAAGQILVWHRPPWDEPEVPGHFTVVYEDDAIIAVDKPSGLPTMPAGGFLEHTLMNRLRERYPEASPLHRLGRYTSGLVLFARSHDAAAELSRAWRDHDVKKTYRTLACGTTHTDMFVIDAAIGPVPHPLLGDVEAAAETGKPSRSIAMVLESRGDHTLFSVEIKTGRPHQIRIHMAYAGHPLVGDPLYCEGGIIKHQPGLPGDGGYLLHAERLVFAHPLSGTPMTLLAPPPRPLLTQGELRQSA